MSSAAPNRVALSRDQDVQATADDALMSKLSAANLGYFHDPYLQYFVRKTTKRSPLINRGYYARVAAVAKIIQDFLAVGGPEVPKQIVSLGAGYDSSYFRVKASGQRFLKYFEVDFPDVCARKGGLIRKHVPLQEVISAAQPYHPSPSTPTPSASSPASVSVSPSPSSPSDAATDAAEKPPASSGLKIPLSKAAASSSAAAAAAPLESEPIIYIEGPDYVLLRADLRETEKLEEHLVLAGINFEVPTLFISECVLVYMKPEDSARVIEWIPRRFTGGAAMMTYEQVRPDDAFGRTMMANLESRGCPLLGLRGHPTLDSQRVRFESRGWTRARALDMNDIYRFVLPADDVRRIERLELWDEYEEWNMIQAHYCITLAQLDARAQKPDSSSISSSSSSPSEVADESASSSSSSSSASSSLPSSALTDAERQAIAACPLSQISFLLIDTEAAKQRVMKFID